MKLQDIQPGMIVKLTSYDGSNTETATISFDPFRKRLFGWDPSLYTGENEEIARFAYWNSCAESQWLDEAVAARTEFVDQVEAPAAPVLPPPTTELQRAAARVLELGGEEASRGFWNEAYHAGGLQRLHDRIQFAGSLIALSNLRPEMVVLCLAYAAGRMGEFTLERLQREDGAALKAGFFFGQVEKEAAEAPSPENSGYLN